MKAINIMIILCCSISLYAQPLSIELPQQDADSLSIKTFNITIDTTTKDIEIIESSYDMLDVFHLHRRYKTSLYELDTVVLIINKDSTQCEIRLLMCEGRAFSIDDPYKGKVRTGFIDKKKLRLGYWQVGPIEDELNEMVDRLNHYIPKKEACNSDRNLKQYLCHKYLVGRDMNGLYSSGIIMPSLNGSNSVQSRHDSIQTHLDECVGEVKEPHVFKVIYTINEAGRAVDISSFDCPKDLEEKVFDCLAQTQWTPGQYDGKPVATKCATLIGFNVEDKFAVYEQNSKKPKEQPKQVTISDDALEAMFGTDKPDEEEVFRVVEDMPKPLSLSYYEELKAEAIKAFPDQNWDETLKFIVEKDGYVSNVNIIRSTNKKVGEWLKAEMRKTARYEPGKQRGIKVRVQMVYRMKS
jgi:hypothetical protein